MSAGITDPNGTVTRVEHTHDGYLIDEVDYINLSDLQFDDDDDVWLYMPLQCSTGSTIQDIYVWLKTEPELDVRNNKKCIDTRTFTRSKKRSARMSFESIFEGLPPSTTDVQKLQDIDITYTENVEKYLPAIIRDKESVPPILKPSTKTVLNMLSDEISVTSGQESMEAFLNMSQSKGIDSFINLGEPEFSDMLMNISQPSILSASVITNESIFIKNNISVINKNMAQNSDMEKSSNSDDINNETYVMQNSDKTITPDKIYCTNNLSNTCKEFLQLDKVLNETYNAAALSGTSARSSLDKQETTLSSTFVTEPNANFVQLQNEASNGIELLDTTYLSSAKGVKRLNSPVSIVNDVHTYIPTTRVNKADLNVTCDILPDKIESVALFTRETLAKESALDMSFNVPVYNQSTPMNPSMPNATSKFVMKHLDQPQPVVHPTLKAPTSLRRELLAEIQRSGERKLDSTYNHIPSDHPNLRDTKENVHIGYNENETDGSSTNKYYTYKKSAFTRMTSQYTSQNEMTVTAQKELPMDQRKFYTFTKKNNPIGRTNNIASENVETHPSMDSTFCKPHLPKIQQKRNVPRALSKLPQFLQKSNPNLVSSSLKNVSGVPIVRTSISSIGYIKGSQSNIKQNITKKSQLPSKLHPYGKMKSGSEQRLLEANVNTNNQFPMKDVIAGSTESIESTHSVHSAPDLDDRLSTCSDSSNHNSCSKQTMNIEQLHQLVRMQEESLKQDLSPKPNRQVLENTWIAEKKDLPSPILKNGVQHNEIDEHLLNNDLSMKSSSPIISPTGSSHALNDGNAEGNIVKTKDEIVVVEKTESPNQVVPKTENKTRLRQPTNWSTGSKPATVISGIPRPASRIPALRFVRPNAKTTQIDLRKGCT
ncbi:PREDICTED: uncharacterized protein LOC105148476 [Acromyrmex echinatior]|uniref:Uncharacterized protein n=1 Tax=Acromyrmex echinatior TaxID=103372 RepID=F4WRV0_ACREC|nr:PREDICTED: uncharacterized protein LOC105148476 [Acromyrmex echinatior]EGI63107.1 hypothetical protein G5I_08554 [Acromyrmex echinatior]